MTQDCPICEGKGEWRRFDRQGFCDECEGTGELITYEQALVLRLVRKMLNTMHERSTR